MGLDMYAYKRRKKPASKVDFEQQESDEEVHYWRKHPDLHGWMESLYRYSGGSEDPFNSVAVLLGEGDLDLLEEEVKAECLPKTYGFLFGQSYGSDDERNGDLEFIEKAREAIKNGWHVYYTSWW